MGFTSDPESEVFMGFRGFWILETDNKLLNLLHELETQLTVLQYNPTTTLHMCFDGFS